MKLVDREPLSLLVITGLMGIGGSGVACGAAGTGGGGNAEQLDAAPLPGDTASNSDASSPPEGGSSTRDAAVVSTDAAHAADGQGGDAVGDGADAPPDGGIPADCPGDPTQGWTEYTDTFSLQYPYNLTATDRYTLENGVYTLWVFPNDKPHEPPPNTTGPRSEMAWSTFTTGEHMMSEDVMFESPMTNTCITQIKSTGPGEAVFMQVNGGNIRNGGGGPTVATGFYNEWFNLKVAIDPATLVTRVWINNCLMDTGSTTPDTGIWYFKNGVYGCNATICRDHFTNIHHYSR